MKSWHVEYLADALGGTLVAADGVRTTPLSSVTSASQAVAPGTVFVAVPGVVVDGHQFVESAFKQGAVVAVATQSSALAGRPGIVVADTRRALSQLAALFAGHPSERMAVVGITGTNGKTTINWMIHHAWRALEIKSLRVGTLGTCAEGIVEKPGNLTTPDPVDLHSSFAAALAGGAAAAVIEASSHALDQLRVEDIAFDIGVFTNLTRDHLDYHQTMEKYGAAKWHLFELLAQSKKQMRAAVINRDDPVGPDWIARAVACGLHDFSYGFTAGATLRIERFEQSLAGSELQLEVRGNRVMIRSHFIGRHNALNLAAAFATMLAFKFDPAAIAYALGNIPAVPGRLEPVLGAEFGIYVDYAHTPDALEQVLPALRPICKGKLWVVFGCGGDRDKGKRPQMALVAAKYADRVIVTTDNPRTEEPLQIVADILSSGVAPWLVEVDRRRAIAAAVQQAAAGDVILIAGKGHEDYQVVGAQKFHFSDVAEARQAVRQRLGR